jgi:hypothetical protein
MDHTRFQKLVEEKTQREMFLHFRYFLFVAIDRPGVREGTYRPPEEGLESKRFHV